MLVRHMLYVALGSLRLSVSVSFASRWSIKTAKHVIPAPFCDRSVITVVDIVLAATYLGVIFNGELTMTTHISPGCRTINATCGQSVSHWRVRPHVLWSRHLWIAALTIGTHVFQASPTSISVASIWLRMRQLDSSSRPRHADPRDTSLRIGLMLSCYHLAVSSEYLSFVYGSDITAPNI